MMMRKSLLIVSIAMLALLPLSAESGKISVTGSAEVSVRPDTATFTVTATAIRDTTDEARTAVSSMINEAAEILETSFGVPADSISTSYISAYPEYRWEDGEQILIGQKANESISVTIHDIEALGDIYTKLMGINGIGISDVSLDKEDKSAELEKARVDAVHDARTKAETYAGAAGVRIGDVISISDSSSSSVYYPRANIMYAMAADESASVSTEYRISDITVSSSVSIVYELLND